MHCFRFLFLEFTTVGCHILGDVHKHRPRPSASGNGKSPAQSIRKNVHILYNIIMLRDRHGDSGNVHLLKGVLAKRRQYHIAGDRHHRHGIHISRGDTGHQIGGAGAACRQTDSYSASGPRIAVRRMSRSLLMRRKNMLYFITMLIQSVIYIKNRAARIAEHSIHTLFLQTFHNDLRPCQ